MLFLFNSIVCVIISIGLFGFIDLLTDKVLEEWPVQYIKLDILSVIWVINLILLAFNAFVAFLVLICIESGILLILISIGMI